MFPIKTIISPSIPMVQSFLQAVQPNQEFIIVGSPHFGAKGFAINWASGPVLEGVRRSDIPFHFNPRFDQSYYVARNSLIQNNWGKEEGKGNLPFIQHKQFTIRVLLKEKEFSVEVDGKHFTDYSYRVPIYMVNTLQITGDVTIMQVVHQALPPPYSPMPPIHTPFKSDELPICCPPSSHGSKVEEFGSYCPTVPFDYMIHQKFGSGKTICLTGKIPFNASRFNIDLLSKTMSQKENVNFRCTFQFRPSNSVIRNGQSNCVWGKKEISIPSFPVFVGGDLELKIRCEEDRFVVFVKNVYFFGFVHRAPYHAINKMRIEGDLLVSSISCQ